MAVILARVQVPKGRLGDLVEDLATKVPYVKIVGLDVAVPSQKAVPSQPVSQPVLAITDQREKLTKPQEKVLAAIKEGISTEDALTEETGIIRLKRVVNMLIKKKLVKGRDGTYTATHT